jgi:hypothetical protein
MLTPERFNVLQKAFKKAKYSGLHDNIHPPPMTRKDKTPLVVMTQPAAIKGGGNFGARTRQPPTALTIKKK